MMLLNGRRHTMDEWSIAMNAPWASRGLTRPPHIHVISISSSLGSDPKEPGAAYFSLTSTPPPVSATRTIKIEQAFDSSPVGLIPHLRNFLWDPAVPSTHSVARGRPQIGDRSHFGQT